MILLRKDILGLIDPHLYKYLEKFEYEILEIKAKNFLSHNRFDLAIKLIYLEMINNNVSFSEKIYKKHIHALTNGKFKEYGNSDKNSFNKFIKVFQQIFKDIKTNGFNSSKSIIPLSKNFLLENGSHRVACAIYFDMYVKCIHLNKIDQIYDYNFFYNRNVSVDILDAAAIKFAEYSDNLFIAFIWPTAQGYEKQINNIIPNIVYRKNIKLNPNGAHNLLSQIYNEEKWLGNEKDNFKGSRGKLVETFKNFNPVRVLAFQADSLESVLNIKQKLRTIFKVGKHSVHITDTKNQAMRIARLIFNDNNIHFLNYARPNKFISTHLKIKKFKKFLLKNNLDEKDVLIDSSLVLSCYGLREARDIDFLCINNNKIKYEIEDINIHDEVLPFYKVSKQELIYNQKYFFYFSDLKFMSFKQIYNLKSSRGEKKDFNDLSLMKSMNSRNLFKKYFLKFKQNYLFFKIKVYVKTIHFLKIIRLHSFLKKILYLFKR